MILIRRFWVLLIFSLPVLLSGQSLGQDQEGFSTIVIPSAVLNLDLANEVATFNYTGYLDKNKDFLIGGELKGKSVNGISSLFNSNKVTASGEISGMLGWYFLENSDSDLESEQNKSKKEVEKQQVNRLTYDCLIKIEGLYDKAIEVGIMDDDFKRSSWDIVENSATNEIEEIRKQQDAINGLASKLTNDLEKEHKLLLIAKLYGEISNLIDKRLQLKKLNDEINNIATNIITDGHLLYTRWRVNGVSYRKDLGDMNPVFKERIPKETFNGWRGEIGYNYRYNRHFMGLGFAANYMNNINNLDEKTFDLIVEDDTIEPGLLRSTTTLKAYDADEVDEFHRYDINLDYAYVFQLKPSAELNLSLNPYLRHSMYANAENFKNRTDIGLGLFAFNGSKSKLLGGAFVQLNDTFNVNEDPENETTAIDRVNFGLVVKVAFSGLNVEKKE